MKKQFNNFHFYFFYYLTQLSSKNGLIIPKTKIIKGNHIYLQYINYQLAK